MHAVLLKLLLDTVMRSVCVCVCVLIVALVVFSVQVNAAPMVSDCDYQELDDSLINLEIIQKFINGILNNSDNVYAIKKLFDSERKKLCTYPNHFTTSPSMTLVLTRRT